MLPCPKFMNQINPPRKESFRKGILVCSGGDVRKVEEKLPTS